MNWGNIRSRIAKSIAPSSRVTIPPVKNNSISLGSLHNKMNMPITELSPGMSQPVWGPEINSVGSYSREGYTSKFADIPAIPFRTQAMALQIDEDVQLVINRLSSQVTGGEHYIESSSQELTDYLQEFSHGMSFDTFDTILIKELLWYGNSVWKPRMGVSHVRSLDDLMHIPISSFVRVWWDRQRIPYKYEFRGAEYQGYHNPGEIIHFTWNPIDASVFGTGFGVSATSQRAFEMVVNGDETSQVTLPSMLDRKYAIEFIMQMASQRYVTRNVYQAAGANEEERNKLQSFVEQLKIGQDLVSGTQLEVQELGTNTRSFNPEEFVETVQSPIMKALNDFSGKQGSENSHTFANAETAKEESDGGLSAFTINVKVQLIKKLFEPWYKANPFTGVYMDGLLPIDWKDVKFNFNFGALEKKDISTEELIKLIDSYQNNPILMSNTKPLIEMYKMAGVPIDDDTANNINNMYNDPNGQMALDNVDTSNDDKSKTPNDTPQFDNYTMGIPPQNDPTYNSMSVLPRGKLLPSDFHQSNQSQDWETGRQYE